MNKLQYYLKQFSDLKVSNHRERGQAHYKPILLLSVIELIAQGFIKENHITVSDELIEIFDKYWRIFGNEAYKGGLTYPFLHMQNEGFWHLKFQDDFNGMQPKTINKLKQSVRYAYLNNDLFELIQDEILRTELVDNLLVSWFSSKKDSVGELLKANQDFQDYFQVEAKSLNELPDIEKSPKIVFKKSIVRNALFRKSIVYFYEYRCAFCRLKVVSSLNQNIVDGAHIKPLAKFYNSQINNGIALCKNHHWAFDRGWFSIDDDYKIMISDSFKEDSPNSKPMNKFEGELICLPPEEKYFPAIESLAWHRQNVFIN